MHSFSHRSVPVSLLAQRALRSLVLLVLCGTALLALGCPRRVTDFTVISTKNTMLVAKAEKFNRRVTGEDCTFTLVGLPNMKTAIDDAIEKAGDEYDALVDGVVWYDDRFLYVCYRVEGTPLRAVDLPKYEEGAAEEGTNSFEGQRGALPTRPSDRTVETETGKRFEYRRDEPAEPRPAPRAEPPARAPAAAVTAEELGEPGSEEPTPDELYNTPASSEGASSDDDEEEERGFASEGPESGSPYVN